MAKTKLNNPQVELLGVRIENLRGFSNAFLPLDQSPAVLVGANNAGKTSIFKILQWIFSINEMSLRAGSFGNLLKEDFELLRPARNVGNKASRISLRVKVLDGRRRRRFNPDKEGISTLRINFKLRERKFYVSVENPRKSEPPIHTKAGADLLRWVLSNYHLTYISPNRISGTIFNEYSLHLLQQYLRNSPGPSNKFKKGFDNGIDSISIVTREIASELKRIVEKAVPKGYLRDIFVSYNLDSEKVVQWIANQVEVKVATGIHDRNFVSFQELGTGILALITLLLQSSWAEKQQRTSILAVEEPEAFLHPPAQRTLAQYLLKGRGKPSKGVGKPSTYLLMSTHSPLIVEEADYCHILIVSEHKIYQPFCKDKNRAEINSTFMAGHGAEMLFYRNILFVEGEADRLFFTTLFKRMTTFDSTGMINSIKVVPVGGNNRFAPWIRLVSSFSKRPADNPFSYLVIADGDSASEIKEAAQQAGLTIAEAVSEALNKVSNYYHHYKSTNEGNETKSELKEKWLESCVEFNKAARAHKFPMRLFPGDLEYVALAAMSESSREAFCRLITISDCALASLLHKLGSKASDVEPSDAKKQPWIRQKIAEQLEIASKSDLWKLLVDILVEFGLEAQKVKRMLNKLSKI